MISCILLESYVETLDDAALAHKLSKCKFSDPSTVTMDRMRVCVQASRQSSAHGNCPEYQFRTGYTEENVHGCFQHKGTTTCTCTKLSACFADEEILVDENGSTSMSKNEMYCLRLRWNKKRDDTTPRTFVLSSSRTVAKNISKEEERRLRDPVLPRQTEDMRSSTTVDWWDFLDQLGKKSKTKEEETRTRTTEAMTETTAESTTEATEGTSSSTAESTAEATITETTLDSTTEATEGTSSSTAEESSTTASTTLPPTATTTTTSSTTTTTSFSTSTTTTFTTTTTTAPTIRKTTISTTTSEAAATLKATNAPIKPKVVSSTFSSTSKVGAGTVTTDSDHEQKILPWSKEKKIKVYK
ncbi:hypothetical protein Y032_0555g3370 [Ancylostoma ceylanicum]|nr:hypothetical protein Y032_0555g3370 [Ancylostoma ceylanicum]